MIGAGRLRQVIVIQHITGYTTDAHGGNSPVWSSFAVNVRAEKKPLSGRELIAAQAAQSETVSKFIIRYIPGVTQAMRIIHDGKYHNITAVIDVNEAHRELQIMAGTGLNEG